ncbi:DivIVA domain-containing protein [Galbitalea sp. SE-J8]|uniref:DivIVA domain-containing protein n=1 Tax=Galbitalea sp. SE-J8 TaxID=3054952 RepID=UPI00259CA4AA|nr:DivIVA domain-containing protein [Galbitalea sp. SE-J8]MDM4762883.1 DivIVA domain-containing protein [Galbitalea sp. SE-J8]
MSSTFPRTRKSVPGYDVDHVEDFLEEARRAYTADPSALSVVSSSTIRRIAFPMTKGGYSPVHVDAALERLEDAFAQRERDRALAAPGGQDAWFAQARETAQVVLDRLARPAGERFSREGQFTRGYDVKQVDAFLDRLVDYFQSGAPMSVEEVRTVAFSPVRHGYSEAKVDYLLETVVRVMLAVR